MITSLASILAATYSGFSIFEFGMLACFSICWPVSLYTSVKTKKTEGKSLLFIVIIFVGYISGVTHKIIYSFDFVIILYIFNLVLVLADIVLYLKYSRRIAPPPATLD